MNTSSEQRQELIRLARAQSNGKAAPSKNASKSAPKSSFQMRFFIAVLLLSCAILLDKSGINLAGITSETIVRVISADYETHLEEWIAAIAQ